MIVKIIKRVKMAKMKYFVFVVGLLVLMLAHVVSADFGEWFRGITGRASTTGQTNATIALTGSNNVSVHVWNDTITAAAPVEDGTYKVIFNITVTDLDGAADINDSSVDINVTRAGGTTKVNDSCNYGGQLTSNSKNYSCSFDMWYFDESAAWTITTVANDYGTRNYKQNISTFYYGSLTGIKVSPTSLTWPGVSPAQTNQTSSNDPLTVNNTGNYPGNNLTITGINLVGTDPSYSIDVRNFTVNIFTGGACSGATCLECNVNASGGIGMANNTERQILNANATRGNNSINDGTTGQEYLYFCMPLVPSNILSQTYATPSAWTITIRSYT